MAFSFLVTQQTREIGVRIAMGALPRDIVMLVQRSAGAWTGIGIIAGITGSLGAAQTVRGLLFEVAPNDPLSLAVAAGALAAIAVLAAWVPSCRAARVDPLVALRHE